MGEEHQHILKEIPAQELAAIKEIFKLSDANQDGTLNYHEMKSLLRHFGVYYTSEEMLDVYQRVHKKWPKPAHLKELRATSRRRLTVSFNSALSARHLSPPGFAASSAEQDVNAPVVTYPQFVMIIGHLDDL